MPVATPIPIRTPTVDSSVARFSQEHPAFTVIRESMQLPDGVALCHPAWLWTPEGISGFFTDSLRR